LSWDDRQWQIAEEALRLLFEGDIAIERQGARFTVSKVSGIWKLEAFERSLTYLTDRTGPNREIDPFERSDSTSWIILSQLLSILGQRLLALDVILRYLKVCYDLQNEHRRRMHKGAPLFWASQRYRQVGESNLASGYMLLAFIEDCEGYQDPREAPAYTQLLSVFRFSPDFLQGLVAFAREQEPFPDFPEEVMIGWELINAPGLPEPRARSRGA
jgi:hypothetical protein